MNYGLVTACSTRDTPPRTTFHWLAAVGMLFVLGSFTMLLRESLSGSRRVADISIRVDEILPSAHG